jgi:hypothetical protein
MAQSATFMQRFVATDVTFKRTLDGMSVNLANTQGLRDIAFAVPLGYAPQVHAPWLAYRGVDQAAGVFAITDDRKTAEIALLPASTDGLR